MQFRKKNYEQVRGLTENNQIMHGLHNFWKKTAGFTAGFTGFIIYFSILSYLLPTQTFSETLDIT